MNLLTEKQKDWLIERPIKIDEIYMFPRFGFNIYENPDELSGMFFDTNPFTKSLDSQRFVVKEIINGFARGNFYNKPTKKDFYLKLSELKQRDLLEIFTLYVFIVPFFVIYNLIKSLK